jgi:GDPmannose 4,6-dehydratase
MQWLMLQQDNADDFVIATGHQISVRDFFDSVGNSLGITFRWQGEGVDETGIVDSVDVSAIENAVEASQRESLVGKTIVRVDPKYFRPTEVDTLLGDPSKAKEKLGWSPKITVHEMIQEMVEADLDQARRLAVLKASGFDVSLSTE